MFCTAHYQKDTQRPEWEQKLSRNAVFFLYKSTKDDEAARKMELEEIEKYQPKYNH